jgi:hypothetical protein
MNDIIKELIHEDPPEVLYHYTDQVGLLGIFKSNELWLSHTQYLNDGREYSHALELVRAAIDRRTDRAIAAESNTLEEMRNAVKGNIQSINVCVASFSMDGDDLSQWRGYGGRTVSFAIGFDGGILADIVVRKKFYLARCIYDVAAQIERAERLVDRCLAEVLERKRRIGANGDDDDDHEFWNRGGNLVFFLHAVAPTMKDQAFRGEREWRIISRPLMSSSKEFDYRPGNSMLVPYYKLALFGHPGDVGKRKLHRLVVSPTPNAELAVQSARSLLASRHMQGSFTPGGPVSVELSKIPYRSW